jgi:hypothetical protein
MQYLFKNKCHISTQTLPVVLNEDDIDKIKKTKYIPKIITYISPDERRKDLFKVKEAHANLQSNLRNPDFTNPKQIDMNYYLDHLRLKSYLPICIKYGTTRCDLLPISIFNHFKALKQNPNFQIIKEMGEKYGYDNKFLPYTQMSIFDLSSYNENSESVKLSNTMCHHLTEFLNISLGNGSTSYEKTKSIPSCDITIDISKIQSLSQ